MKKKYDLQRNYTVQCKYANMKEKRLQMESLSQNRKRDKENIKRTNNFKMILKSYLRTRNKIIFV